ncbi:hypothetical protein ABZS88_43005 [Streptomyces sp. NPDC005480]|uniref:hypothetical protein n=1 Tax=Streptomyces sp. NPDC005480 TaxID=3154880 RepID=UPI0033A23986
MPSWTVTSRPRDAQVRAAQVHGSLVTWAASSTPGSLPSDLVATTAAASQELGLHRSLDSLPELLLLRTYCARYAKPGGFEIPALIPQVYLHYDPYTRRSGKQSGAL